MDRLKDMLEKRAEALLDLDRKLEELRELRDRIERSERHFRKKRNMIAGKWDRMIHDAKGEEK